MKTRLSFICFICLFFCSNTIFATPSMEQALIESPGIFCGYQEAKGIAELFKFVEHFEIDDNMMFKEGQCDIFVAMLMRRNASPGCFLLGFETASPDKRDFMIFNLRLLFSLYGDAEAWPLPEVDMKEEYLKFFPDGLEIAEKHLAYLYNSWSNYLLKPESKKKDGQLK